MASRVAPLLRGKVRRLLREHGYASSGQTFRKFGQGGLIGIIEIGAPRKPPAHDAEVTIFLVGFGVWVPTPRPWLSPDLQNDVAATQRHLYEAQVCAELLPTARSAWSRLTGVDHYPSVWASHAEQADEPVRQDLYLALADIVVPSIDHQLATRHEPFPEHSDRVSVSHVLAPFEPTVGYVKGPPAAGGIWADDT